MARIVDINARTHEIDNLLNSVKRDEKHVRLLTERISLIRQMDAKLSECRYNLDIYDNCKQALEQIDIKLRGYRLGLTEFDE